MIRIAITSMISATLAFASTTMCFKQNHIDPSSIESTPLQGGECKGQYSVQDMKEKGYDIKDIKITVGEGGMNYMYIFSKEKVVLGNQKTADGQALTKEQLRAYLYEMQEEEKVQEEQKERIANIAAGKARYEKLCKECHGMGDIVAYNKARPLKELSQEDFEIAITDYKLGLRKGSMVMLMEPMAKMMDGADIENIHAYLQSLK